MNALTLKQAHDSIEKAQRYVIGFVQGGKVYSMTMDNVPMEYLRESRASSKRGGKLTLRIYIKSAIRKLAIVSGAATLEGDAEILKADKNAGLAFEKYITEKYTGKKWARDDSPFWVKGDANISGIETQIKLNGATYADMASIEKLLEA